MRIIKINTHRSQLGLMISYHILIAFEIPKMNQLESFINFGKNLKSHNP